MILKESFRKDISAALAAATGLEPAQLLRSLETPKKPEFGDAAFPCFSLAKEWKVSPVEAAKRIAGEIKLPPTIAAAEPLGPFLNFRFARQRFMREAIDPALSGAKPEVTRQKIIVEYSSPNIAKPFHVGHLRATLIGNCLDRVCRYLGHDTRSINHLGDWGTQFGFVWAGCKFWGFPEKPSVIELVELYRRATSLKERQEKGELSEEDKRYPDINQVARDFFIDLEKGEAYAIDFWKQCVNTSLEYLRETYKRLGITFDHYIGESFYSDKLDAVRQELEQAGILTESQGALGVALGEELGFARILTPDGRSLYLTRDLATAKYRAETFGFDRALYVVGAPQSLHFQQLKAILKALGRDYAGKIEHVAFGHVLGMKTRGGNGFIELNEFLDEAKERALEAYRTQVSKRPAGVDEQEAARAVALAAIMFSNLSRSNIKDVNFSWQHALEFQGDTGPYLLYACARINGIKEKAEQAGIELDYQADLTLLTEESAYQLALLLSDFEEKLLKTASEDEPSILASYALDLAKAFSRGYLDLQVVGAENAQAKARLLLFEATRRVLSCSLQLLGIEPIDRM